MTFLISRQAFYAFVLSCLAGSLAYGVSECSSGNCNISGPYCGINCVYSALKFSGKEIKFTELLKPEYIGSKKGSSLAELRVAAQDNGMYAEAVSNLSISDLRNVPHFVILHVKSNAQSEKYDHYQLFLGIENNKARLFDPPNPVQLVSFSELAPLWDGTGLIVSATPIALGKVFWPARKMFLLYTIAAAVIIMLVRLIAKKWLPAVEVMPIQKKLGLSLLQGGGLGTIALLAGLIFHFVSETGFLANAGATNSIQQGHLANFMPKVSADDIRKEFAAGAILIDARYEKDYKAGHIEGAVNIPITLCDAGRQGALSKINKTAKMVVYCQSAGCKYAETVAGKLHSDGFSDISIYKGGWQDWQLSSTRK